MSTPYAIALTGFSPFERSTLVSFFRLAARRDPGYEIVGEDQRSLLIIANADDPATMSQLQADPPSAQVLLIGASAAGSGWPIQPRPIKLMSVLTAVDQMLAPKAAEARAPLAAPAPARPAGPPRFAHTSPGTGPEYVPPKLNAPSVEAILLVDDSDTALKFMRERLRRFGFTAELVRSGEQALQRLDVCQYRFVFLDVELDGMDGYKTCKAIKQRQYPDGHVPVVVMMSGHVGAVDKFKGARAGCDAYLAKPLDEKQLLAVLAKHDPQVHRGFQGTQLER
jgi:CheY-like chemotaxis protein